MKRWYSGIEILLIIVFALFPLMGGLFPYRLNIFLSYEGAYRLYLGQIPYKDFGIPLGFMYWVIPALFFKIFGPYMISLVKAQVFINIIAGLSFRAIFKNLSVNPGIRVVAVLLFCLSYSFLNYWPWYNHTVIVYELIALAFLTRFIVSQNKWRYLSLVLSGAFTFFSFFTKQDAGAMAFLICLFVIIFNAFVERKWLQILIYASSVMLTALLLMLPFAKYGIGYWFNHGQPPHTSRFSFMDFAEEFFNNSEWLKFYFFIIALLLIMYIKNWKQFIADRNKMVLSLITIGILVEAAIFQVTSYIPPDNNIFFHSFAFVFIIILLSEHLPVDFNNFKIVLIASMGVMLWWSGVYWKFIEKYLIPKSSIQQVKKEGVNKKNYLILKEDSTDIPMNQWREIPLKSFDKMLLPGPTVDGINRLMQMPLIKNNKHLKVLNMSELTPLAKELPFNLETGSYYPLWYHKGVGMFQKETDMFCDRIRNNYYDLVLFEYIPYLNNFYPFEVRDCLIDNYEKVDVFTAPRKPSLQAWVEVYIKRKN
jgi:hypothetical protein